MCKKGDRNVMAEGAFGQPGARASGVLERQGSAISMGQPDNL